MIRIFYGAMFFSWAVALMPLYGGGEHADLLKYLAQVLVAFQMGLIALVVPSLSSAAISSEIETGTFETLRLSRLRGGTIFWGKLLPTVLPALLPVLALLPAYYAVQFVQESYLVRFLLLLPVVVLAVFFCVTLGILCSSLLSQSARATVAAYLVAAALFALPLFAWWASGVQLSTAVGAGIAFLSPLVMAIDIVSDPTSAVAALRMQHLWVTGSLCVVMIVVARLRLRALLRHG
jgi:ABC-type Na+ efflux pump permease subunit